MDKKKIIKDSIRTGYASSRTSRANRGIYRTGPWSDGLNTTNVIDLGGGIKPDGAGGLASDFVTKNQVVKRGDIFKK